MPRKKEIGVPIGRNMSEGPIKDVLRRIGEEKFTAIEKKRLELLRGSGGSVYCRTPSGRIWLVRESNLSKVKRNGWVKLDSKEGEQLFKLQRNVRK